MSRRRHVLLAVAILAATVAVTSSGAFSATTADRDVSVDVAEDPNAYLGFNQTQYSDENVTANVTGHDDANGTVYVNVTVTNQFQAGTNLTTVEVTANGTSVDRAPLASGESVTHTFSSVSCGDPIRIDASGDDVAVRLERTVTCS